MTHRTRPLLSCLLALMSPAALGEANDALDAYNVLWTTPSKDSSESMPCGGGDIGLNVWVEDGDVLLYMQRSGSLAEQNEYLKLGRVRLRLDPNPFEGPGTEFRQELKLRDGHVEIVGRAPGPDGKPFKSLVRIWVDVHRPVIHLEMESSQPVRAKASYENWRLEDEVLPAGTRRHSCINLQNYPGEVTLSKDSVAHRNNGVLFHHRNPGDARVLNALLKQQGLEAFRDQVVDDLSNRTFGGLMTGAGFKQAGYSEGVYQAKKFGAWHLQSGRASKTHRLRVVTHIDQTETLAAWQADLDESLRQSAENHDSARTATQNWWHAFWDRSHIIIKPGNPDPSDRAWRIARNYNLFRYQLGCNAIGEYPTKFNGGNFTVDANLIGDKWEGFGPDWRQWGGGVFTAQNQRLIYWPMLKSGDVDAILPQFELYRKALPGARARVKANFKHEGAIYAEYLGASGIAPGFGYGWDDTEGRGRGEDIPFGDPRADALHNYGDPVEKGVMACKPISYHWESQLENAYMILEYRRFTGADISNYIPFIENAVVFIDQHYRKREQIRSGRELDGNGHLVIYPSKACESFRGATNPADIIAALEACVDEILALDDDALALSDKAFYRTLKDTIPPYEYSEGSEDAPHPMMKDLVRSLRDMPDVAYARSGIRTILPARSWKEYGNGELPMLYPLFPFNRFALGSDDMQVFRDTYQHGFFRKGNLISWHQDGIFFARMGQTDKAADFNSRKLDDSQRRFPTFWGPGHDWTPDHNWGGSGMIGLQEMLMQTIGDEIRLLPAWPKDWDVDFKLHAPKQTTVTGKVRGGKVVDLEVTPASRKADVVVGLQEAKPE